MVLHHLWIHCLHGPSRFGIGRADHHAVAAFARSSHLSTRLRPKHFSDLATLLVTLVILWAYNAFSQLLIIWMGNLQRDITWYVKRTRRPVARDGRVADFPWVPGPVCAAAAANHQKTRPAFDVGLLRNFAHSDA